MSVTVTGGTSIRLPADDSNYAANNLHHWLCDENSGTVVDSGQNEVLAGGHDLDLTFGGGTITYSQTMVTGLTGIKFDGKHAYDDNNSDGCWGIRYGVGESDWTIEFFMRLDAHLVSGNQLTSSSNNRLWTIISLAGADDRNFHPRIVRNISSGDYGIKEGHQEASNYTNYPGGDWDANQDYNLGALSIGDVVHIALTRVQGGAGVGDIKIYIDNADQGHSVTYIANPTTNNFQDTGDWTMGKNSGGSPHFVLGGRSNNANGGRITLSNVAIWDTALTDFAPAAGGGVTIPIMHHHYDKNMQKDDKCGLLEPTFQDVINYGQFGRY